MPYVQSELADSIDGCMMNGTTPDVESTYLCLLDGNVQALFQPDRIFY